MKRKVVAACLELPRGDPLEAARVRPPTAGCETAYRAGAISAARYQSTVFFNPSSNETIGS